MVKILNFYIPPFCYSDHFRAYFYNIAGDGGIDHERILSLCATVLELSMKKLVIPLVKNGTLLCKIWDGPKRDEFIERLKKDFRRVYTVKPKASRDHSAEIYLLAIKKLF